MNEIEKLLEKKNEILITIGLLYKEELKLKKRLEIEFEKVNNIDFLLSKYDYNEDNNG